jgi:hypothetical protein
MAVELVLKMLHSENDVVHGARHHIPWGVHQDSAECYNLGRDALLVLHKECTKGFKSAVTKNAQYTL